MNRAWHSLVAAAIGIGTSLYTVAVTDVTQVLLAWRLTAADHALPFLTDLGAAFLFLPDGLLPNPVDALIIASWCAWLAAYWLLGQQSRRWRIAFLTSPACLMLAAGGLGIALLGLLILFEAMRRLASSRHAGDVPPLGLALLVAAASVPYFELLILAVASPLFLIAPPDMLRQNMRAFYLVVLSPALVLLTVAVGFGGDVGVSAPLASPSVLTLAAALPLFGVLAVATFVARRPIWRLLVIAGSLALAALLSRALEPLWALCLAGYGAAYAAMLSRSLGTHIAQVIAVAIAVLIYCGHILGV